MIRSIRCSVRDSSRPRNRTRGGVGAFRLFASRSRVKPISQAVPGALIDLLQTTPLSNGKVEFAWKAAVGPAMERATYVKLEGTELLVDAATVQWGREIARSSRVILSRLQGLLGEEAVTKITVRRK